MNVIAQLEFELAYNSVKVQHFSHDFFYILFKCILITLPFDLKVTKEMILLSGC